MIVSFLISLVWLSFSDPTSTLMDVRTGFVQASQNKETREAFHQRLQNLETRTPLMNAYLGASKAMLAEVLVNPYSKYTYFSTGTSLIDEAVAEDPKNAEIRYLRFLIAANSPEFLGYRDHLHEDYRLIRLSIQPNQLLLWQQDFMAFMLRNPALKASLEKKA